MKPGPERAHVDYLLTALFSFGIMPEEQFDKLAREHLVHYHAADQLPAIKDLILLHERAYRLTIRGRSYLVRLRNAGEIDGRPVMTTWDAMTILDRVAKLVNELPPEKERKRHYL